MDHRSKVLFRAMKGLFARGIHDELVAVLASNVFASSTVTNYLRQSQFPPIIVNPSQEPPRTVVDDAILDALQQQSFSSVRELAKTTCTPRSMVHRPEHKRLGLLFRIIDGFPRASHPLEKPGMSLR
jgi:hypothetical protein